MVTDYTKQEELIDTVSFDKPIHVIGCGAIGSWLTFFLLKMGFKNINVYDFDNIEEHNLPNQIFEENQIDKSKVISIQEIYKIFSNDLNEGVSRLTIHNQKVTIKDAANFEGIVFSCVDDMNARRALYKGAFKRGKAELWIEGRIGLFGAYIYTLDEKKNKYFEQYESTLYENEEAEISACGVSQTALPAAVNCATIMLMQMISKYRGNKIKNEILYQIPDMFSMSKEY